MRYPAEKSDSPGDFSAPLYHGNGGLLTNAYARMLASAGIRINGDRPWDLEIRNPKFFSRLARQGTVGLGDSYVEGWWDVRQLDEFFARLIEARVDERIMNLPRLLANTAAALCNLQSVTGARKVGEVHYDLNNDFYRAMLGKNMIYTCGYWRTAQDLDEAQRQKLELVCQKLQLAPGMRVLDIGCGWGGFAKFAAERFGVQVVGITISSAQATLAREVCAGLPVEIREQDYRNVQGCFNRIVSLGMFEHVGHKNYRTYMETVRRNLHDDGIFLLHTIGRNDRGSGIDPWVTRYIFPNSAIPSLQRITQAIDRVLLLEDLHNFGPDYDRTLRSWFENFDRHWPAFKDSFPTQFYRLWKYYLLMFAGVFRARGLQLWQLILTPPTRRERYDRPHY